MLTNYISARHKLKIEYNIIILILKVQIKKIYLNYKKKWIIYIEFIMITLNNYEILQLKFIIF